MSLRLLGSTAAENRLQGARQQADKVRIAAATRAICARPQQSFAGSSARHGGAPRGALLTREEEFDSLSQETMTF